MPRSLPAFLICVAVLLAGCTRFPELAGTIEPEARTAGYPSLLTVDELAALSDETGAIPGRTTAPETPESRIARLKARAARLRGGVIDQETRARMEAGVE